MKLKFIGPPVFTVLKRWRLEGVVLTVPGETKKCASK